MFLEVQHAIRKLFRYFASTDSLQEKRELLLHLGPDTVAQRAVVPHTWRYSRPGWMGPGQPELVGQPAHGRGLELGGLRGPFQPKPFCDSMAFISYTGINASAVTLNVPQL